MKVFFAVFSILLVILTGCGKSGSKSATITIWDFKYGDAGVGAVMKEIDALIMQQNPGITIEHVAQPNDNYYQLVRAAVQAGEGPDIVMFHAGAQAYEFDEYTAELDKYIKDWRKEIDEYSWSFCSEGGNASKPVHLVPLTIQGFGIYYNKADFKKAGLDPDKAPSDYASFMDACDKLKKAGIQPIETGLQGSPYGIDFLIRTFVANIYGSGVKDLVTGKQSFKGNEAFSKAVDIIKEMFDKGYISMKNTSTPYFVDSINNYKAGKAAMFFGLLSDIGHWKDFCDALGKENIGYFPTINFAEAPNKDTQVLQPCGIGYSVMKWSKNPEAAAKVIAGYASGDGNAIWMGKTGALSPNKNMDINKLGYPLVGQILKQTFATDLTTLLTNEDANQNMDRYIAQYFVSKEITKEKFIDSFQSMLENAKK
ncbi:MAG: extracellular solute-binding protein [Spirochaetes bacterium]|nr:extracellular solute-binding protein [Spirochaetota bacterium]